MEKSEVAYEKYIRELEEKIIDLSLKLKSKTNELNSVCETNQKTIGKLVHNLKNPVGIIYSFSDMILDSVEDYSPVKLEKYLKIINSSADYSIKVLNSVAKYSQLQLPNLEFSFKAINYTDLLDNVLSEFNSESIEKNITIKRDFPGEQIFLKADKVELSIALNNIINNAFRYSSENSEISIRVKLNENSIETIVSDEGIGISKENLPQVLNDFFVVNTYSNDKQKCIGLGLTISNKIIQKHNGKLIITSEVDNGTNAIITLPN